VKWTLAVPCWIFSADFAFFSGDQSRRKRGLLFIYNPPIIFRRHDFIGYFTSRGGQLLNNYWMRLRWDHELLKPRSVLSTEAAGSKTVPCLSTVGGDFVTMARSLSRDNWRDWTVFVEFTELWVQCGPLSQWVARLSFLFRGCKPPDSKPRQNGLKPPPGTQRHQNNAMET